MVGFVSFALVVGSLPAAGEPVVYGYLPSWQSLETDVPWDHLTHLGLFAVEVDSSGALINTSSWRSRAPAALLEAEPRGIQVELSLAIFSADLQRAALGTESRRLALADALEREVVAVGAHGVNLDIEFMPTDLREPLVALTEDLKSRGLAVTLALPLVDWSDAYDIAALSEHADGLFIMGYDVHWAGGDAGPVAPLFGSDAWGWISLDWSADDVLALGADPAKVWMGLPLYGRGWSVSDASVVPAPATYGSTGSVTYATAVAEAAVLGRRWDPDSATPWYDAGGGEQVWYDDPLSLTGKMQWALLDRGLGGVGFWALGYDAGDPVLWGLVDQAVAAASALGSDDGTEETADGSDTGSSPSAPNGDGHASFGGAPGRVAGGVPASGCGCSPVGPAVPRGVPLAAAALLLGCASRRRL